MVSQAKKRPQIINTGGDFEARSRIERDKKSADLVNQADIEDDLGIDDDAWKLGISKEEREKILLECHDEHTAGHLEREKTYVRVARYYYWEKYYQAVKEHVRASLVCQQCKKEQRPLIRSK